MFLWRTVQNYPLIIIKYPPYLFHCLLFVCLSVGQQSIWPFSLSLTNHIRDTVFRFGIPSVDQIWWVFLVIIKESFSPVLHKNIRCGYSLESRRKLSLNYHQMSHLMRLWYLLHRRPVKAQASLRICAVSPEPSLFAHIKYGSRQRVQQKNQTCSPTCVFEE